MIDIITHMEGQKVETKSRSSSTASTASIKTVSSTESENVDTELVKLRKESQTLEDNLKRIFNRKPCDKLEVNVKSYEKRINELDKNCNGLLPFLCSADEKKDINLLKEKIDKNKDKLKKL